MLTGVFNSSIYFTGDYTIKMEYLPVAVVEIPSYDASCRLDNQNIGPQTIMITQDASGRSTGTVPEKTVDFVNNPGAKISSNLKFNFDGSIIATVTGLLEDLDANGASLGTQSYRTEFRVATKENGVAKDYYLGDTLQSYAPTLPDPNVPMDLESEFSIIGYPDKVDRKECVFKVLTEPIEQAEVTEEYEQALICSSTVVVLVDDDGALLVDDAGNYLIEGE